MIARLVQALSYVGMWSLVLTLPLTLTGDADPVLLSAILIALPSVVSLLQLALSRSREYDADLDAVALTGDPEGLAGALEALERSEGRLWERAMVARRQVVDPVLLRTHPSTAERARRLRALLPREDLAIGAPFGRNLPEADHLRDRRRPRTLRVRV